MNVHLIYLLKIIFIGIGIGLGIFYAKYFIPFILWIKEGIENGDGVLHNKDLQIAVFTLFCAFILITVAVWKVNWPDSIVVAVFTVTAALYGIKNIGQAYIDGAKHKKENEK